MPQNNPNPDDNGDNNGEAVKLRVGEIPPNAQKDIGTGVVRIDANVMEDLGIREGDAVLVQGNRETVARVARSYPNDVGLGIIRMDGYLRKNAGTSLGEKVTVTSAQLQEADKVVLAPAEEGIMLQVNNPAVFKRPLHNRAVVKGDILVPSSRDDRPQSMLGDLFEMGGFEDMFSFGFGGELKLRVVNTTPDGPVQITEKTEIEVESQAVEEAEEQMRVPEVTYEDIGGLDREIQKTREMIELPLKHPEVFQRLGIEPPSGLLLHGPPGTGKTLLAKAVANEADAHFISLNGPEIMSKFYGESEKKLREVFQEAQENAPSIIFIDELDAIASKRDETAGEVERRVVAQLLSLMDGLEERKNVIVIGATNRKDSIDEALRRPGRFDREVEIGVPDRDGRKEILQIHTRNMPLTDAVDLDGLADRTHGYVGADIAALCKEAAMNTIRRVLPDINLDEDQISQDVLDDLVVSKEDFTHGMRVVEPSAMREVLVEVPQVSWEDVGGLEKTKESLQEMVEWPLKYPESFERMNIDAPSGILLYGMPGTGKTLLAKAVANESDSNFISIKGPELFSKYVGESEKSVREVFSKARQVAPCIVFIDEIDSLAPRRGQHMGDSGVGDRVVNQLLSELDGVESLEGVVIVAATNRPDMIDPAVLRPGRIDRHMFIPNPDEDTRREIFEVHIRGKPVADDVDIDTLARRTEGYVGSDIEAVCREAAMNALRRDIESDEITWDDFEYALDKVNPSAREEHISEFRERMNEAEGLTAEEEVDYLG